MKSCSCTKRYCVSKMKLLMSGDIELNPGPEQNVCDQTALSVGSTLLLNYRLGQLGLRPLDNFLYFSFTTSCLEIKVCSIHFIVTTVMLIIVSTTSKKMSAIISTTPQSRPTSTPPYFSISPSTRLLVLAIFLC